MAAVLATAPHAEARKASCRPRQSRAQALQQVWASRAKNVEFEVFPGWRRICTAVFVAHHRMATMVEAFALGGITLPAYDAGVRSLRPNTKFAEPQRRPAAQPTDVVGDSSRSEPASTVKAPCPVDGQRFVPARAWNFFGSHCQKGAPAAAQPSRHRLTKPAGGVARPTAVPSDRQLPQRWGRHSA